MKETDLTDRALESHPYADSIYRCSDVGWFVPPAVKGILYYGIHGGAEWCGGAYAGANNILYVTANELAWLIRMKDISGGSVPIGIINEIFAPDAKVGLQMNLDGLKIILKEMGDLKALRTYK